ncbi:hypothetical protein [Sporosarcina sp. UB5]|uniref:hypothetical protein n=1 Tax=Sporosarcina sp. UB5 TaxID=3047463 RepID=UPI003D7971F3
MKFKLGLVALFLSISVLLLQSNSFSTADIRNDLAVSVVEEDQAFIMITEWDGRNFNVVNNTQTTVWVEGMTFNVDGDLTPLRYGEIRKFTLIGKASDLSGSQLRITFSWESGRAEITSIIPLIEDDEDCTDQLKADEEFVDGREVIEDTNLQEIDGEKVSGCIEQPEADEESEGIDKELVEVDGKNEEVVVEEIEDVEKEIDGNERDREAVVVENEGLENEESVGEADEKTVSKGEAHSSSTKDDVTNEAATVEDNNSVEAYQTETIIDLPEG